MGSRPLGHQADAKVAAKEGAEEGDESRGKAAVKSKIVAGLAKLGNAEAGNKMPAISFLPPKGGGRGGLSAARRKRSRSLGNAVQSLPSVVGTRPRQGTGKATAKNSSPHRRQMAKA